MAGTDLFSGMTVHTHNGKHPNKGGHRVAYSGHGYAILLQGRRVTRVRLTDLPKSKPKFEVDGYHGLEFGDSYGECPYCYGHHSDPAKKITDQGKQWVVRCNRCNVYLKPHPARLRYLQIRGML